MSDRLRKIITRYLDNHCTNADAEGMSALCECQLCLDARVVLATPDFDLYAHLQQQREFSERTFGPGPRTAGVIDHIRKELREIEKDPSDISEWIDVVILGLDGAWRAGYTPEQIIEALTAKQETNEAREWPDWREAPAGEAIEHKRTE